jgi:hypothetical protein
VPCLWGCTTVLDPTHRVPASDASPGLDPVASSDCTQVEGAANTFWICESPLASYDRATEGCRARGAELAPVRSPEENSLLASRSRELSTHTNLWIGGTRDDEQVWRWSDGTEFWRGLVAGSAPPDVYVNWQSGEPNNISTVIDEPERCAALALFDEGWRDRACSLELSYVCALP